MTDEPKMAVLANAHYFDSYKNVKVGNVIDKYIHMCHPTVLFLLDPKTERRAEGRVGVPTAEGLRIQGVVKQ